MFGKISKFQPSSTLLLFNTQIQINNKLETETLFKRILFGLIKFPSSNRRNGKIERKAKQTERTFPIQ
jgi:hypothetical protein